MNNKTKLLEDYLNFVDMTKKQNKYFKINLIIFVAILCFSLFYLKIGQSSICTIISFVTHTIIKHGYIQVCEYLYLSILTMI